MKYLTTAQRLATYRDELLAAGFDEATAGRLIDLAAPADLEDVAVQSDQGDVDEAGRR